MRRSLLTATSGFPAIVTRFYLKTMAAFPVHLNSAYVYPISEFDALKTWMNKVLHPISLLAWRVLALTLIRPFQHSIVIPSQ